MTLLDADHELLNKMIIQLEQSQYNHLQWHNALIRTLVCRLPPDQRDTNPESYKACLFGQWYYSAPSAFLEHPGFKALGEEHKHMHILAANLLGKMHHITPLEFDAFANSLERLRLEVSALIREIENLLYNRDPLTGAINRVNMLPMLRELQDASRRDGKPCSLIMMDLDNFKEINDQFGHKAGDIVLTAAIQYIIQHIRPFDKVFRYGGEEFLISFPNLELIDALELIERLRKALEKTEFKINKGETAHVTASFGLTLLDPISPVEQAIETADKALLAAKAAGKNCSMMLSESILKGNNQG